MGAVQHDSQAVQLEAIVDRGLAELDVAPGGVIDADRLAEPIRRHGFQRLVELVLDFGLDLVGEFQPFRREELDAVILVGIVRRRDHDPGIGPERARQIGDARRGHRPQQRDIGPGGREPRLQCRFEHVPGNSRVFTDDHLGPRRLGGLLSDLMAAKLARQHSAHGPAQLQHEVGSDGILSDSAADTVGTEITSTHDRLAPEAPPKPY